MYVYGEESPNMQANKFLEGPMSSKNILILGVLGILQQAG